MNDIETRGTPHHLTPIGRMMDSILSTQFGRFVAELVLIVVGILTALAIDGWAGDVKDRETERSYLEFLARDIEAIRGRAISQIDFEKDKVTNASEVYAALSTDNPAENHAIIGQGMGSLSGRQTLVLNSATYDQIVNSGHLQLIRNTDLRDQIVRYFDRMERYERIIEKNNRDLVDYIFAPFLMRVGITAHPRLNQHQPLGANTGLEILNEALGADIWLPEDRVLSSSGESDTWNDIRRNVLWRARIAAVGQGFAETILAESDEIAMAVAAELEGS